MKCFAQIPNGNTLAGLNTGGAVTRGGDRYCGRFLHTAQEMASSISICSK